MAALESQQPPLASRPDQGRDDAGVAPRAAGPSQAAGAWAASLLDEVLQTRPRGEPRGSAIGRFTAAETPGQAMRAWIEASAWRPRPGGEPARDLVLALAAAVAQIDSLLTDQLNAVLHHPRFQQLEAAWRGLHYLVGQVDEAEGIVIRVLALSRQELTRDLERAIEFDQSALFKKVYESEFGTAGGKPFGLLIGDYEFSHQDADVEALDRISGVAAAAFAPFIAGVAPALLGLDRMTDIERPLNLPQTFEQVEYVKWRSFRKREDSRFVGLAMPKVLMRTPYADDGSRIDGFCFREDVSGPDRRKYLWGNAAFAFGAVVVRSFADSGWLAGIRGVRRRTSSGGLVVGLPAHEFATDARGIAVKSSTEVILTEMQEQELGQLGLLPLCHCRDTALAAFYGVQSVQQPKKYDDPAATANARMSSMLHYILCASRFAHYIKVIARDKVGTFAEAHEVEDYLHRWLHRYVLSDSEAGPEIKARYPLREARIEVVRHPAKPGSYLCTMYLRPHFELDELSVSTRLTTDLAPSPTS
jgi:type VI secretion system ImpC/EvpB family protein